MLKKLRKSSSRVTLVLIGAAALGGCGGGDTRDVYASREDCLADWGNKPEDCSRATEPTHVSRGYWYGPGYYRSPASGYLWGSAGRGTHSIGNTSHHSSSSSSSHVSRGGFGSSGHSSSSG